MLARLLLVLLAIPLPVAAAGHQECVHRAIEKEYVHVTYDLRSCSDKVPGDVYDGVRQIEAHILRVGQELTPSRGFCITVGPGPHGFLTVDTQNACTTQWQACYDLGLDAACDLLGLGRA